MTALLTPTIPMVTSATVAFWILAPIMVLAALTLVISRKAVHSALSLAIVMISLAILYAVLDAPFLFVVQIIVYTGAILMLFLFVVMLVGIDSTDSMVETLKGHRIAVGVVALAFVSLLVFSIGHAYVTQDVGLSDANDANGGNLQGLAALIFTRYVFVFEATSALLITAAVATMVLAHGERLRPRVDQRQAQRLRLRAYADKGVHPGALPNSGVYARNNMVTAPALLPDGSVAESSLSPTLSQRGVIVDADDLRTPTHKAFATIAEARGEALPVSPQPTMADVQLGVPLEPEADAELSAAHGVPQEVQA